MFCLAVVFVGHCVLHDSGFCRFIVYCLTLVLAGNYALSDGSTKYLKDFVLCMMVVLL